MSGQHEIVLKCSVRIVNTKLSELFERAELKTGCIPCVVRPSDVVYEGFSKSARRLSVPTEFFISGYLRWAFRLPVLDPEPDAEDVWAVFEDVGETTDTFRDGTTAEGMRRDVALSVPAALTRQFSAAAAGVDSAGEDLLAGYLEAIFGVEGSESFERWLTFIHGIAGRVQPLVGFFRRPEL